MLRTQHHLLGLLPRTLLQSRELLPSGECETAPSQRPLSRETIGRKKLDLACAVGRLSDGLAWLGWHSDGQAQ